MRTLELPALYPYVLLGYKTYDLEKLEKKNYTLNNHKWKFSDFWMFYK